MSEKFYLNILKFGSLLAFASLFLVFRNVLFPFITSKQIVFNMLMEVLLVIWAVLIWQYPKYRPKLKLLSYGLLGYFLIIFLSCLVSVDFSLSFWGDTERMLGFVSLVHFLIFYLVLITAFRTKSDWKALFTTSVAVALGLSLYGLIKHKAITTIGNEAYVAGYLIFNLYLAVWLFVKYKSWWRYVFLLALVPMLLLFVQADITGAYLGLGSSLFIGLILVAVFYRKRVWQYSALGVSVIIATIIALALLYPGAAWVKDNPVLSQISWQKRTFQTRLIAWNAAYKNIPNYPVLGTGHGTFTVTFDKYFDPEFYNYKQTETYFDRAHNNILDIVSTTGILGLAAYLLVIVTVFVYLIKIFIKAKKTEENFSSSNKLLELIILFSLLIGYLIQNLAVFDSLPTYISLFAVLAYIRWLRFGVGKGESAVNHKLASYLLWPMLLIMLGFGYWFNILPIQAFNYEVSGYQLLGYGQIEQGVERYSQGLALNTPFNRDSRTTLVEYFLDHPAALNQVDNEKGKEIVNKLMDWQRKNLELSPQDTTFNMQMSQLLTRYSYFYKNIDQEEYDNYNNQALDYVNRAIDSSPGRVTLYWLKGQILIELGQKDEGISQWYKAIDLNPDYGDSYCYLTQAYLVIDDPISAWPVMDQCISSGGLQRFRAAAVIGRSVQYYVGVSDFERLPIVYERYAELSGDVDVWMNLAELYAQLENWSKAKQAALQAKAVDNGDKASSIDLFIKIMDSKLNK